MNEPVEPTPPSFSRMLRARGVGRALRVLWLLPAAFFALITFWAVERPLTGKAPLGGLLLVPAFALATWAMWRLFSVGVLSSPVLSDEVTETGAPHGLKAFRIRSRAWLGLAIAVFLWTVFLPHPRLAALAVAALAPIAGLLIIALPRSRLHVVAGDRSDRRVLTSALFFAGAALGVRALWEHPLLSPWTAVAPALLLAAVLLALTLWSDRRARSERAGDPSIGAMAALVLAAVLWGWGAVVFADTLADRAPVQVFVTPVLDKQPRRRSVILAPWGPMTHGQRLESPAFYDRVETGDHACVRLHSGALGMAWAEIGVCRTPKDDSAARA